MRGGLPWVFRCRRTCAIAPPISPTIQAAKVPGHRPGRSWRRLGRGEKCRETAAVRVSPRSCTQGSICQSQRIGALRARSGPLAAVSLVVCKTRTSTLAPGRKPHQSLQPVPSLLIAIVSRLLLQVRPERTHATGRRVRVVSHLPCERAQDQESRILCTAALPKDDQALMTIGEVCFPSASLEEG